MDLRRGWTASTRAAIIATGALVFAAHAACYLYFFVDDSAIPAVYAQNLLAGRGLVYTPLEGRVEGYSDFLNVLISAGSLLLTRALHIPKIEVLHIGMALSFGFGIGLVILTGAVLARAGARLPDLVAALGCIALAGPLAVWSCSSLEAVPFAFCVTALAAATIFQPLRPRVAVIVGVIAVLYRLDGFVFIAAVLAGAFLVVERTERRTLIARVVVPIAFATGAYHLWRLSYFHSLLSAPIEAKVLYKLFPAHHVVVKAPAQSYLRSFINLYGLAVVPAVLLAAAAAIRDRRGRGLILTTALLVAYVDLVGDWMFGWRFVVPLLSLVALIIGMAATRLRTQFAWLVALTALIWSTFGARSVAREFVRTQHKPIWWTSPRGGERLWLAPYGDLTAEARTLVAPGETIAYNQAGLVPFLLDADNIDDLGICSKFEARLPTTDVYFTEVGRYAALTDAPIFNAVHAYLLYRNVRMIISRTDLLRGANHGGIPASVVGGYYKLHSIDASGQNAIYLRTDKPAGQYRRDPSSFQEDLIHSSRIVRADVDGAILPADQIESAFPFLRWQTGRVTVRKTSRIALRFAEHDEDVMTLFVDSLAASSPVALTFSVFDEAGRLVTSAQVQADPARIAVLRPLPPGTRGRLLVIEMQSSEPIATVTIGDMRLNGQSTALKEYVLRSLSFSNP